MKKRILSMMTALCLMLALFPVTAFADDNHVCTDYDKDHRCDTCRTQMGTCEDANHDHFCDYGCDKWFGNHEDANHDHKCDYGCNHAMGTCEDADHDHQCDYGCEKTFGEHKAAEGTHTCDYCGQAASECKDEDPKDHQCDVCGAKLSDHSGGTATCIKKATCDYCGEEYGSTNPDNHAGGTVVRHAKEATCTEDGYTGDTLCKDCGMKLSNGTTIEATGHTDKNKDHICDEETCKAKLSEHSGGTATCIKKATCDYCGEEYDSTNPDNHAGGTVVRHAKEATCTEDGYTGDTLCKDCGMKLSDGTTIEATGHTDKNKDHICDEETCKEKLSDHSGGTATCKDKAVCDYCKNEYGELDKTNHVGGTEIKDAKKATCTEDGYTGDTYCKGCGEKLSEGASVAKTGHNYESKVTKEATTTSTGTKIYTCKNCGHSYEEEIAKLPSQSTSPKTGDETPLVATIVVTLLSAAALIGLATYKKRGRYSAK